MLGRRIPIHQRNLIVCRIIFYNKIEILGVGSGLPVNSVNASKIYF